MRFFLDRNLSPHLAKAVAALCIPHDISVAHHDDRFTPTTTDLEWIGRLVGEGNWAVVTQDRLTKNPLERQALRSTALLVFILAKHWPHAAHWDKAAALVRWMPALIGVAERIGNGAFLVPYNLSGKGKIEAVTL